jgi:succinate dehydrogenase / fumarate reductase cytochrome b subunit
MAERARPLSPFLHYRWRYTMALSFLHRVTGVLLSLGFLLLVYWLAAAAAGPGRYAAAVVALSSPLAQIVLFGAAFAFCYHLLNGIRHLVWDTARGFELQTARRSGWAVAIGAIVLSIIVWLAVRSGTGGVA